MAVNPAIFQRYDDDILRDAVWSGTAPSTSYSLATLGSKNPAARVRFGATSATVTATITSARGDIFVLPMHNVTPGSSTIIKVTNNNGFDSGFLTVPALQANGLPPTLTVDLTGMASAATRTATVWNVVITTNGANVILGGAIAIYTGKTTFTSNAHSNNFLWDGYTDRERHYTRETMNEYGTRYLVDYGTASRSVDVQIAATLAGLSEFRDWFRGCHGNGLPGLFWADPSVADSLFGTWQPEFAVQHQPHISQNFHRLSVTFDELAKGQALA